jgi:hypothetical protein
MSRIKNIIRKKIDGERLYNLAVKKDESFVANGIVVHNCRSVLIPIFVGENTDEESYFSGYQDKMTEADNVPDGFGG